MKRFSATLLVFIAFAGFIVVSVLIQSCDESEKENTDSQESDLAENTFAGDQACMSCHSGEHDKWLQSHHYQAMLPANDSTVRGDFNDQVYSADGIDSRFFRKDNKFYINTRGPDGSNQDFQVQYVFGYEPLQQYLVEFPGGRLQTSRQSWDTEENKWFHQYPDQDIPHDDWLDWSNGAQTWNTMCADCHSTNLVKGYDFKTDSFHTTWSSINVSCESCHGPGSRHVKLMEDGSDYEDEEGSHFVFGKHDTTNVSQVNTCAPCHSRRSFLGGEFMLTGNYFDNYIPELIREPYYHPDGQVLEEDYVYGSFVQSKMYHNFVKCTDCHDPHSMKLKIEGNMLCGQCHAPSYNTPAHHFHEENTISASCVSCHMPSKYYMGNDLRHDHSFRIPRPDQSVLYGTPNTCNSCHNDKSARWAADAIRSWYGEKRAYHFSDDLLPGSLLDQKSGAHLMELLKRDSIPDIARATAIYYMGLLNAPAYSDLIVGHLMHESPLVRKYSIEALMNVPSGSLISYALPLLEDETRIVRIAAYEWLLSVNDQIPDRYAASFNKARAEYEGYLDHQLDFPAGRAAKGIYLHRLSDYSGARYHYESAIALDDKLPGVRTNLSTVYSALGENESAKEVLIDALELDETNGNAMFNLALLYNEMGQPDSAIYYFEQCLKIIDYNPRIYYNYGLLLEKQGYNDKAEKAFIEGLNIFPDHIELNYALAVFYLNAKQPEKAEPFLKRLTELQPGNEDFMKMLRSVQGS